MTVEMKINEGADTATITIVKKDGGITLTNILYAIKSLVEEIYEDCSNKSKN